MIVDGTARKACNSPSCTIAGITEQVDWVLRPNITYLRSDGLTPIFTADLNGVVTSLLTSPDLINTEVFTGLSTNWLTSSTCNSWTNPTIDPPFGSVGSSNQTVVSGILKLYSQECNRVLSLYCVEQHLT